MGEPNLAGKSAEQACVYFGCISAGLRRFRVLCASRGAPIFVVRGRGEPKQGRHNGQENGVPCRLLHKNSKARGSTQSAGTHADTNLNHAATQAKPASARFDRPTKLRTYFLSE